MQNNNSPWQDQGLSLFTAVYVSGKGHFLLKTRFRAKMISESPIIRMTAGIYPGIHSAVETVKHQKDPEQYAQDLHDIVA